MNQANVDFITSTAAAYIDNFISDMEQPPTVSMVIYAVLRANNTALKVFVEDDLTEASQWLAMHYSNVSGNPNVWLGDMIAKLLAPITPKPKDYTLLYVAGGALLLLLFMSKGKTEA
jgi:glycerol uptake facilitator-like aquaporin